VTGYSNVYEARILQRTAIMVSNSYGEQQPNSSLQGRLREVGETFISFVRRNVGVDLALAAGRHWLFYLCASFQPFAKTSIFE
jgi:hypothetical protein